jgi:hypothetical protein
MKTISQIIAEAQALLNISFNLTECFEEYLSDKYKHFCICCGLSKNRCRFSYGPMREPDGYLIRIHPLYGVFLPKAISDRKDQPVNPVD